MHQQLQQGVNGLGKWCGMCCQPELDTKRLVDEFN